MSYLRTPNVERATSKDDIYMPDELVDHILDEVAESGESLHGVVLADTRLHRLSLDRHLRKVVWSDPVAFSGSASFFLRAGTTKATGKDGRLTVDGDVFSKPVDLTIGSRGKAYTGPRDNFNYPRMFDIVTSFICLTSFCIAKVSFPLDDLFVWLRSLPAIHSIALIDVSATTHDWFILSNNVTLHAPHCRSVRRVEIQGSYSMASVQRTLVTVMVLLTLQPVEDWKLDWVAFRCVWEYILTRDLVYMAANNNRYPSIFFFIRGHPYVPNFPTIFRVPPGLSSLELVTSNRSAFNGSVITEPTTTGLYALEFLMRTASSIKAFRVDGLVSARCWYRGAVHTPHLERLQAPMHFTHLILSPESSKLTHLRLAPLIYEDIHVIYGLMKDVSYLPNLKCFQMATVKITTPLLSAIARTFPKLEELVIYANLAVLGENDMLMLGECFLATERWLEVLHLYAPDQPSSGNYSPEEALLFLERWGAFAKTLREVRLSLQYYQFRVSSTVWSTAEREGTGWEIYNCQD
ncbi:hypothetical protein V5O48_007702 [Marasmius crinis-equi]|uniref:Uncharacterized protein n=1 Tax=Marasmius crinis-equi TaxID=585013 RepID=A0ABR3FG40_9AGAR